MPPRGYKRNQYHDEFSDDSEETSYKQSKKELKEIDEQQKQIGKLTSVSFNFR